MKPDHLFFARRGSAVAVLAVASLLAGCASSSGIAPAARPLTAAELGLGRGDAAPLAADWWKAWGDDALSGLIEQALRSQPSLKVAQARLERAQAAVDGEQSADGLHVNASADTTRQHFSATSIYPAPLGGSIRTLANAQVAAQWEFDFFGRHRAALDAALGQTRAAQADLQAARNLLASQVAQTWVQLGRLLAQREVAQRALVQREQMLGLIRQRVEAGLDTRVELRQGEGALPDARQQIEQINEQIALTRHALAALVAQPQDRLEALTPDLSRLHASDLPAALPADLLGRRPDLAAARWRVEAATRGVDVARAQFYPNVNLTAFIGLSSIGLDRLIEADSRQYGVGPAIRLPIFDSGALRANLRGRTADLDAAVEGYNSALLESVRDAADQLSSLQSVQRQQTEQAQALAAAESAHDIALQRYRAGLTGQLTVLAAETTLLNQRRLGVDLRARDLTARIGLVRALGGGYTADAATPSRG
jgi:NodT family efflux transporter outer membrane factor (OMF) lipoprotein